MTICFMSLADFPQRFSDAEIALQSISYWVVGHRTDLPANSRSTLMRFSLNKNAVYIGLPSLSLVLRSIIYRGSARMTRPSCFIKPMDDESMCYRHRDTESR